MSLSSLANEEIARTDRQVLRAKFEPHVRAHLQTIAQGLARPRGALDPLRNDLVRLTADTPTNQIKASKALESGPSNVLDALAKYIPVEVITLYVAASSALPSILATFPNSTAESVYWFFVVLTPVLFLIVYAGKRRAVALSAFPPSVGAWPWWKTIAATIAFGIWALAIPTTPYLSGESGKVVAALGALLVSTFLTLLEPLFAPGG